MYTKPIRSSSITWIWNLTKSDFKSPNKVTTDNKTRCVFMRLNREMPTKRGRWLDIASGRANMIALTIWVVLHFILKCRGMASYRKQFLSAKFTTLPCIWYYISFHLNLMFFLFFSNIFLLYIFRKVSIK